MKIIKKMTKRKILAKILNRHSIRDLYKFLGEIYYS